MQKLYETALNWMTASDNDVVEFKRIVKQIVGFECNVACKKEWLVRPICEIYVLNNEKLLDQHIMHLTHLTIHQTNGFGFAEEDYESGCCNANERSIFEQIQKNMREINENYL